MDKQVVLGIDPGLKGGLCFFDITDGEYELLPMPLIKIPTKKERKVKDLTKKEKEARKNGEKFYVMKQEIHTNYIANLMRIHKPTLTILEKAYYPLGQRNDTTAERYGELRGLIKQHHLTKNYEIVTPQTWKGYYQIGADKDEAIALAELISPKIELRPTPRSKPSDGLAEAFLIALYGKHLLESQDIYNL